eukprot:5223815-Pyramimonas_sp.AAC.1
MERKIRGAGEEADADLFHFHDEWVGTLNEVEELDASSRPAIQGHFYRKMQTCPCVQFTLVLYDHCSDEYGT